MERMEKEQMEQFQYAHRRLKQKKRLWYHFVVFILGCIFLYIANNWMEVGMVNYGIWYKWAIYGWAFLFLVHVINVFITDRFMNAKWEEAQIQKLMAKQQQRLRELEKQVEDQNRL